MPQPDAQAGGLGSLVSTAAGGNPYAAIAQGGIGLLQSIFGGISAKKNQKKLEQLVDSYKPNESIMDYYNKALTRYNPNPYNSASYRAATQGANRSLNAGLNALQDRRSALAGVNSLVQGTNDASLRAAANAEREQAGQLAQLGQATGAKAAEDRYKFENKYNLLAMKAAGGNKTLGAGISNAFNALGGIEDYYKAKNLYQ